MKYEEFIEQVQTRAQLASNSEAGRATRAMLETLAECISKDERYDAASQLPRGLALYLKQPFLGISKQPGPRPGRECSLDDFFQRMSIREDVPLATAREHARVVMSVLSDALSKGELEHIREQLPIEFFYEFFAKK
ncbi:hypothetical protein KDA_51460 [Dictyobacter alpinus]|uniref:DUF2267 domain-containing protein n=1 Tax=Dictyobacter alpinus TaxID=2014873 RepID=A0A402BEE2_9CHLR|nr:DUF2267 domain-containing protein [Dictyobacter alpinus]GCE29662.1 hypothetical protein KDA_51460 [Dictyobacter alpinus]